MPYALSNPFVASPPPSGPHGPLVELPLCAWGRTHKVQREIEINFVIYLEKKFDEKNG